MKTDWPLHKLGELTVKVGSGATPRGGNESYQASGVPLIRSMNVRFEGFEKKGLVYLDEKQAAALDSVRVEHADVLLNITGASIGRVTIAPPQMAGARVNQHVSIVRPNSAMLASFLAYFLASPRLQSQILDDESGVTRQALTKAKILDFDVPVPPVAEQERIVAQIDILRSKSRNVRNDLDEIPSLLEQYRQSVLAAAFRGDLTADWRASHPDAEPATVLLDRIRQERRHRWEAAELARMKTSPRDDRWKAKYQEPEPVDEGDLPELPEGWCWTRFGDVINELRNGLSAKPEFEPPGHPILRINSVRPGRVLFEDLRFLRGDVDPMYLLRDGDLLFTRYNGSLELLGICGVVRGLGDRSCLYPDKLMRVRLDEKQILPEYVEAFFAAPDVRRRLEKKAKSSAGQQGISGADIKEQLLALPPVAEQIEIVRLIRKTTATRELVSSIVSQSLSDLSQLDQAVLAKAFRGELVPQDPDDEPASALLDRIRVERQSEGKGRSARSRQGRLSGLD